MDHDSLVQSVGIILGSLFPGSLFSSHVTMIIETNLTGNPEIKPRGTFGRILENGVAMGPASRFALQVWYHHDVGSQEAASQ